MNYNHKHNCKCNHNCNGKLCRCYMKIILKSLLITVLVFMSIFLCVFLCNNKEESYNGTIIPFSSTSSTGISLATNPNGEPINMALLSFGYGQNISAEEIGSNNMNNLNFNLQEVPWETSFVMPRDGEITSISFSYTNAIETNSYNFDTRIIVKLYTAAANSEVFTAIPEATFELDKLLNGVVVENEVITGGMKDLSIKVEEDTKILLALYIKSDKPNNTQQIDLIGAGHAGINIK